MTRGADQPPPHVEGQLFAPGKSVALNSYAGDFGTDSVNLRAALHHAVDILNARHRQDFSAVGHDWRDLALAIKFNDEVPLFSAVALRINRGDEFERLKAAVAMAADLRFTVADDIKKLDFLRDRVAKGAQLFPEEAALITNLEWQIRGRAPGSGAITDAEASLLNEFWNFREEYLADDADLARSTEIPHAHGIDEVGLRWIQVQNGEHPTWALAPLGGRHGQTDTAVTELSSHFFRERRHRREAAGHASLEESRLLARFEIAARSREQQRFSDSADAFRAIISEIRTKYPPPSAHGRERR